MKYNPRDIFNFNSFGYWAGNQLIMIDPDTEKGYKDAIDITLMKFNQRIHIFYSDITAVEELPKLLEHISKILGERSNYITPYYAARSPLKIFIHVSHYQKDLWKLINKYVVEDHDMWHLYVCTVITERVGPTFRVPGRRKPEEYPDGDIRNELRIMYGYNSIGVYATSTTLYPLLRKDANYLSVSQLDDPSSSAPIDTLAKRIHPELFKDDILAAFKESAPKGILSTFKSDDEIWDFITLNGEWGVKEENP